MKLNHKKSTIGKSVVRRLLDRPHGQSIVLITLALFSVLGMAAISIDVGRVYYGYQQLKAATQEAALAGGSVISNDGETAAEAEATATSYSAGSGDSNAITSGLLSNIKISATLKCLTSAAAVAMGVPGCNAYAVGDNALAVTETATVPTTFARVFGIDSWPIGVTALASAKGGFNGPYNVAIIVDTTASMQQSDAGNCGKSRITCALEGVQTLLNTLSPCPAGLASCGSASTSTDDVPAPASGTETEYNVSKAVDEASLFVFPGLPSTSVVSDDTDCPTVNPPITSYNGYFLNSSCTGGGTPAACCTGPGKGGCTTTDTPPVYEIVPFSSDYRASDSATSLTAASNIVIASGGGCRSGGVGAPGGEGTFYAGVIYAAQSGLITAQSSRPNGVSSKNVMILVSDGQANATTTEGMEAPTAPGTPTWKYSATGQCAQAVAAAQAAAEAGTTVYAVGYGSESTGCTTDTGTYSSPVCTMQGIANSPSSTGSGYQQNNSNFFTDVSSTTSSCASAARSTTTLDQIFQQIANDLTVSRLIPNGTT